MRTNAARTAGKYISRIPLNVRSFLITRIVSRRREGSFVQGRKFCSGTESLVHSSVHASSHSFFPRAGALKSEQDRARNTMSQIVRSRIQSLVPSLWKNVGAGQTRSVGNLPVKPNKFVEEFAHRRENIENEFTWDTQTISRIVIWGVLVPYGMYHMTYVRMTV